MAIALRNTRGFTTIELIMVIVILGVLSAFALPRIADLGGNARVAVKSGLSSALNTSIKIAKSKAFIDGLSPSVNTGNVQLDGVTVDIVYSEPAGTATGIGAAAGLSSTSDLALDYTTTPGTLIATIGNVATCTLTYSQATCSNANQSPCAGTITPASITVAADASC